MKAPNLDNSLPRHPLEYKIPPPLVVVVLGAAMGGIAWFTSSFEIGVGLRFVAGGFPMTDRRTRTSPLGIGLLGGLIALTALLGGSTGRAAQRPLPSSSQQATGSSPTQAAAVAPQREGRVKANGITIAYESFGPEGRAVMLLIMGNGAQLTVWPVELIEALVKRGYRVIIYDNRDVGLSTKFDRVGVPDAKAVIEAQLAGKPSPLPYALDDMARDAVGLLDALGVKKAHIVGVSMGGMIAQLVAADHPEHVLSLTSIMSTSGNPDVPFPADPEAIRKMPPAAPEGNEEAAVANAVKVIQVLAGPDYPPDEKRIRDLVVRSMKRSSDRAGMARHNALSALGLFQDRRAKLKIIKVPAVVVHGAKDPIMSVEGGKDTAANIPGAELRIIPGMGHDLPIRLVDTIADAITAAASRATGAGAAK
jgi:pimeloyl-ACP methyl ester carboxylesterase